MAGKRRVFGAAFKAKVALAAAKGDRTTAQLASQFGIHTSQVTAWKKQLMGQVAELFADGRQRRADQAADEQELFEQIGRLKMEVEWLKKKLPRSAESSGKRVLVREVQVAYRVAERRACRVLGFSRTTYRYRSRRDPRAELRIRLRDLAASRVHYGYPRLWVLLHREGWLVNKKLVYRLYCEEGLGIKRRKPRRRKSVQVREARPPTGQTNESWSMDFMADQLVGGQRFRLLTLVDNHSRESLAIELGQRLTGDDVVRVLGKVTAERGKPQSIRVDNGPEFISSSLDLWAYFNGVKLDFSRPGKPTDNAVIESFNGRLRDECLNQHWFLSLDEARAVTEAWREDDNRVRPHGALGNRTPSEFARPVAGHAQLPALHG